MYTHNALINVDLKLQNTLDASSLLEMFDCALRVSDISPKRSSEYEARLMHFFNSISKKSIFLFLARPAKLAVMRDTIT